jgi:hypothetical protein
VWVLIMWGAVPRRNAPAKKLMRARGALMEMRALPQHPLARRLMRRQARQRQS